MFRPITKVFANAGSNQRNGAQQRIVDKSKWFRHIQYFNKSFVANRLRFDVSLVKLKQKFSRIQKENKYLINTICLPSRNQVNNEEDSATFFGFGIVNDQGRIPKYLQKAEIRLAPFGECNVLMICANYSGFDSRACYVSH